MAKYTVEKIARVGVMFFLVYYGVWFALIATAFLLR